MDRYPKKCRTCYLRTVAALTLEDGDKLVHLSLVNTSDRNYTDIRIEIGIQEPLIYVQDPDKLADPPERPEVPRRPDRRGIRQKPTFPYGFMSNFRSAALAPALPPLLPKFDITRAANSIVITYKITRIRPEQKIQLDPVLILAIDQPGGELEITWRATVGNADGVVKGSLTAVKVAPEWADRLSPEMVFGQPWESRDPEGGRGFRAELEARWGRSLPQGEAFAWALMPSGRRNNASPMTSLLGSTRPPASDVSDNTRARRRDGCRHIPAAVGDR